MGMYHELHFNSRLKKAPGDVIDALEIMLGRRAGEPAVQHPLFAAARWRSMLRGDSYYFDADTHSTLRYDDIDGRHILCIRCNFKNYENEITLFLDWIGPHLDLEVGEFIGFYRYEEDDWPTLLHMGEDGRISASRTQPR